MQLGLEKFAIINHNYTQAQTEHSMYFALHSFAHFRRINFSFKKVMAAELILQLLNANCIIALGTKWNDKQNEQRKQTAKWGKKKKKNENKLKCILNWQSVLNSTENEMKLDRRHEVVQ